MPETFELFHAVSDPGSAEVRRFITQHSLVPQVKFRNVTYAEVEADLLARGGSRAPALWDGQTLIEGAPAILEKLRALS